MPLAITQFLAPEKQSFSFDVMTYVYRLFPQVLVLDDFQGG